ncbi:MAG: hypothetical protein Kow0069_29350 [Promethearchaeota archaeon]
MQERPNITHVLMDYEVPSDVGPYVCTLSVPGRSGETLNEIGVIDGVLAATQKPVVAINAVGPPGVGKSMLFRKYAEIHRLPTVHVQGRSGTIPEDLLGRWILRKDATEIVLGPLATAVELANRHGSSCLLVDEINLFPPTVHPVFLSLLDYGKARTLDGTVYRLRPGAQLFAFFTMNRDLIATQQLQEAFNERLVVLVMGYPSVEKETEILRAVTGFATPTCRQFARVAEGLRNLYFKEHAFRTPPGTREVVSWAFLSRSLGVRTAFDLVIRNGLNLSTKHAEVVEKLLEAVGLDDGAVPPLGSS